MTMHVVSLFDHSTKMLTPWRDDGYTCWAVDILHPEGVTQGDHEKEGVNLVGHDLHSHWMTPFEPKDIAFVSAFPPCQHLAVSGARWFKGKGLRKLATSIDLFATAAEFCEWSGAPYMIENPISTISTYWRKSDYSYHPYHFAGWCREDNYTKTTHIWTGGGFVMPEQKTIEEPPEKKRIHWFPRTEDRAKLKGITPVAVALAVFDANHKEGEHEGHIL